MHASRPRRKKILVFPLITLLLLSTVLAFKIFNPTQLNSGADMLSVAAASPDTTMSVEPSSIVDQTKTPGSTFTVNVTVENIEPRLFGNEWVALYGWQVHMNWSTAVLNYSASNVWIDPPGYTKTNSHLTFGDFFADAPHGSYAMKQVDYDEGWIEFGETMMGEEPEDRAGISGSGWLATLEFTVVGVGETVIDIAYGYSVEPVRLTFMVDFYTPAIDYATHSKPREEIEFVPENGYFSNAAPQNQLTVNSDPISDVEFTLDGATHTTNWSDSLDEGSYTVEMLSPWLDGEDLYNFDHWEDDSTDPTRTVPLTADQTITAYYVYVPVAHTLTVNSDPISAVNFTVDGALHSTSWSGSLSEDSHTIVMLLTWTDVSGSYAFDHWEDASTNSTRVVSLTADKTVIAYYVEATVYQLAVSSEPIIDVDFTVDGVTHTTNWNGSLVEGNRTVVVPANWTDGPDLYSFNQWENNSTSPTRVVSLAANTTITASYVYVSTAHTLTVDSDPISGVDFTVDGVSHSTSWSGSLLEGSHTVVVPANWTDGPDFYAFDHWEDASTNSTRVVSLTADETITAYYEYVEVTRYQLAVSSEPIIDVEFTLDGVTHTTMWSNFLIEGNYTIVVPANWTFDSGLYLFDHWEDASTNSTRAVPLVAHKTVIAYYVEATLYQLAVDSEPIIDVDFTVDGVTHTTNWNGSLVEGNRTVAMPANWTDGPDFYLFDQWEDNSTNPTRIASLNANKTITAHYTLSHLRYELTVDVAGSSTTIPSPGTYIVSGGTEFSVAAISNSDWVLSHWELDYVDVGSADPYSVIMNANHTLVAFFSEIPEYCELTVGVVGPGTTVPSPGTYIVDGGTEFSVTAVPDSDWVLSHWELDYVYVGSVDSYSVVMMANHTLIAFFGEKPEYCELTVGVVGPGTTVPSPGTYIVDGGTEFSVTVLPDSGWMLDHWELDSVYVGSDAPYNVVMNTNHALIAFFSEIPEQYQLTVNSTSISGVDFTVDGVSHSTSWSGSLPEGSHTVVVPANWTAGSDFYVFDRWEDNSTSPTRVVSLTANKTVTAYYVYVPPTQYQLTVSSEPVIDVEFTVDGVTNTTVWSGFLDEGSYTVVVPLNWTAGPDFYVFDRWEDDSLNSTRVVSLTANKAVTAYYVYVPPNQYQLTIYSGPITDVDFTLDGEAHTTSWRDYLDEGNHTVVVPSTWLDDLDLYNFTHWEDGSTNSTRVVSLAAHKTIIVYYVPTTHTLTVDSEPISGINFTVDGVSHSTPWSGNLSDGLRVIVMPSTWTVGESLYSFLNWEDVHIPTNPRRVVSLAANTTITASYVYVPIPRTLTVNSTSISGVDFTVDGVSHSTSWSGSLSEGSHTIVMSSNWTVGEDLYLFDHWEDASTNSTRVVSLTANKTITASYVYVPDAQYQLTVNSEPITDVEFTLDGETNTTIWSGFLDARSYTVVMPLNWTAGPDFYVFDRWEDNSTSLTRTVMLTSNMTITAYYTAGHTVVAVNPPTNTANIGETFTVDINITNAEDLISWGIKVQWNYSILEAIDVTEGPFLQGQPEGTAFVKTIDNWVGFIDVGCATLGDWFGVWGNGTLMTVTFNVTGTGETDLDIYYAELLNYDVAQIPHTAVDGYFGVFEVIQYQLTVSSEPVIDVEFTVDGVANTTVWSGLLDEGGHTVVMPSIWIDGVASYAFDRWEDDSTNSTRVVSLSGHKSVIAYYVEGALYELTVDSDPDVGVEFTLDDESYTTTWSDILIEGDHTVVMPPTWPFDSDPYVFDHWEDDSTNSTRVVSLTANKTITAYYVPSGVTEHQLTVYSYPTNISVDFTIDGATNTTIWSGLLVEGDHTVVIPSTWMDGPDFYVFDHWEDASTSPTHVISLTADKSIVAYYVAATPYDLTIDSDPSDLVDFTIDGEAQTTTWSGSVVEGNHTVVMPPTWYFDDVVHVFVGWDDGPTDRTRVITVPDDGDYFSAVYEEAAFYDLTIDSDPSDLVDFTIDGEAQTTTWSGSVVEGNHTVVMPPTWYFDDVLHIFAWWDDDMSIAPTRVITVPDDGDYFSAVYEELPTS